MHSSFVAMYRLFEARGIIARDTAAGFVSVARKGIALVGITVVTVALLAVARPDLRQSMMTAMIQAGTELKPLSDLPASELAVVGGAVETALATAGGVPGQALSEHPGYSALTSEQRAAANFLVRKYRLAPDAVAAVVAEAYVAGRELKMDPLLILAVMSIESSMNPFAQSSVGAQGLMQVMTTVHAERFEEFGGPRAALNPIVNVRVGAGILKELIDRHGSIDAGLKAYVGAAMMDDDGGYGLRVLVERARLESAVTGRPPVMPAQQANDEAKPVVTPTAYAPTAAASVIAIAGH